MPATIDASIRDWFPLGRAGAVLAVATLLATVVAAFRPQTESADLTVWTFADTYHKAFTQPGDDGRSPVDVFQEQTGLSVDVKLIDRQAMDVRLLAGGKVGDVVQLELSAAAKLLDRPGGVPLQAWPMPPVVDRTWRRDGVSYALPMDVHPVAWAYRRDLFEEAGVDIKAVRTWADFVDAAR
ncbi:MAG: extracellular solute-binding protein, partial [Planctomycetota bacterium]